MFHNRRSYSERRRSPLRILLIVAIAAILLTVIIGNVLRLTLNEEDYLSLREPPKAPDPPRFTSSVKKLHAYPYTFGNSLDSVWENSQVSLTVNTPDGTLFYTSPVSAHLGFSSSSEKELEVNLDRLGEAASYVSGVFYSKAPSLSSSALCDAEAMREAAILREFLREGGDEILLMGLPFKNKEVKTSLILSYVKAIKTALEDAPLAVAIPLSALEDDSAHRLLSSLRAECDLLALDLTAADGSLTPEEWLAKCDYYLSQYDMRLILSDAQDALVEAAMSLPDVEVIKNTAS